METIKPEVKRRVISDFYHKNLIKKKALYLKAFFEYWLLAHNITPSDGEGGYWGERGASQGSRLSTKPHEGLKKLSKKDEKKIEIEHAASGFNVDKLTIQRILQRLGVKYTKK